MDDELERPDPDADPEGFLNWLRKNAQFMKASQINEDGEVYDLRCPKCKCDKIVAEAPDLGAKARCYECGYEFIITENCFVLDQDSLGLFDEE